MALALLAAFTLGFAAHRAGICTVKAVAEIITTGRAYLLGAFLKTAIWVLSLTILGFSLFGSETHFTHWPITVFAVLGGVTFGIGAAMNGACTFSTLTRIGDGDVNFGGTIVGWPIGAIIAKAAPASLHLAPVQLLADRSPAASGPLFVIALLGATAWAIWQTAVILPPIVRQRSILPILLARQYRLSSAAALIAICNLILFDTLGQWSFTSAILSSTAPARFPPYAPVGWLWLTLAVVVAGIVTSSITRRSFQFVKPDLGRLAAHGLAGIIMGFGAAIIPGGNDSLVLYGIASLSPHALPAYASIIAGIALTFLVIKRFGVNPPPVHCEGDFCSTAPPLAPPRGKNDAAHLTE